MVSSACPYTTNMNYKKRIPDVGYDMAGTRRNECQMSATAWRELEETNARCRLRHDGNYKKLKHLGPTTEQRRKKDKGYGIGSCTGRAGSQPMGRAGRAWNLQARARTRPGLVNNNCVGCGLGLGPTFPDLAIAIRSLFSML